MIRVRARRIRSRQWQTWCAECATATNEVVQCWLDGRELKIGELYKRCRSELFKPFHRKCAYCESSINHTHSGGGDVEHFRPKSRVRREDGRLVTVYRNGKEVPHPGYFWLAYDWRNLIPSCGKCNNAKRDRFPVAAGCTHAIDPRNREQLRSENALLLDPRVDDPAEHLFYDPDTRTGILGWKTTRGAVTIDILQLNRTELCIARLRSVRSARMARLVSRGEEAEADRQDAEIILADIAEGREEHSFAARSALCVG